MAGQADLPHGEVAREMCGTYRKAIVGSSGSIGTWEECTGGRRGCDDGRGAKRRCWRRALYLGIPTSSQLARLCSLSHGLWLPVRNYSNPPPVNNFILVHATVTPRYAVPTSPSIPFSATSHSPISSLAGIHLCDRRRGASQPIACGPVPDRRYRFPQGPEAQRSSNSNTMPVYSMFLVNLH